MAATPTPAETPEQLAYRQRLIAAMRFELVPLKSVEDAITALPPGSAVSVTCSPVKGIPTTIELTDRVRALGHVAVPHIAARMVESPAHVVQIANWLRTEQVGHLFLVGGDATPPLGPYTDAVGFLRALLDADPGLTTVGVPAYPDGHAVIDNHLLDEALMLKQAMLSEAGIAGYATTQMCFDPAVTYDWLAARRQAGMMLPIHLGLAGVVDRARLIKMGTRLGVGTSLRYLKKNRAAISKLLTNANHDPGEVLSALSPALEPLGVEGIHCFTFNQVATTVEWQRAVLSTP